MSGFLDPRQWLLVLAFVAASILGIKFWEHRLVQQGDAAGYSRASGEARAAAEKARAAAQVKANDLQDSVDRSRREKTHAIQALNRDHAAALERLRQRPERPTGSADVPPAASDGSPAPGCTAAQLYREDATLALRESLRAETIRVELLACYQQYDDAREKVNAAP